MPTTRASRPPVLGKLRPPRLGRVFDRQRLFDQLVVRFANVEPPSTAMRNCPSGLDFLSG